MCTAYASKTGPDIVVDEGNTNPGTSGGGRGSGSAPACVWQSPTPQQVEATIGNVGTSGQIVREQAGDPGIVILVCNGIYDGHTWRTRPRPLTAQELATLAYVRLLRNLPVPAVGTTPDDGVASIATIPVFVWLDPAQWQPLSFTETDPSGSGLAVTAVATPTTMTYTPGDGDAPIDCPGPAAPYDPTAGDGNPFTQAAQPGHCTHAYTRITRNVDHTPVPGRPDAWPATIDVTWTVTWTATDGAAGTLNPVTKTAGFDRPVTEVQTLVTG
jgi:hypothetical protein